MKAIYVCIGKILIISGPVYGLICPFNGSNVVAKYKSTKVWDSFLKKPCFS